MSLSRSIRSIAPRFTRLASTTPTPGMSSTNQSHAVGGDSKVPETVQKNAPAGVERSLPSELHNTGKKDEAGVSHATNENDSIVPKPIQRAVPEGLERALPESIHPTGDKK